MSEARDPPRASLTPPAEELAGGWGSLAVGYFQLAMTVPLPCLEYCGAPTRLVF